MGLQHPDHRFKSGCRLELKVPGWEPFLFYDTVSKYKYESFYLTGFGRILLLIKKPLTSHFLTFQRFLLHECTKSIDTLLFRYTKAHLKEYKSYSNPIFYKHSDYSNTYLAIKSTASIYIRGVIFLALPPTRLSTTYEITPKAIPSEIEYINGIAKMQI